MACSSKKDEENSPSKNETKSVLFTKLPSSKTSISFSNQITDNLQFNVLNYPFIYNGGGVAIGDIDNNGLSDIFFTGNMESSRLYMNIGNMQFKDITESAGVMTEGWIAGVSMVDLDNDGYLDIYLSVVSRENAPAEKRANLLFMNNGDRTFTERAKEYNIADTNFTTQAAFLDYNQDGLLDLYLLNHSPGSFTRYMGRDGDNSLNLSTSFDVLYKNLGDGRFANVSREAGIVEKTGYGLGIAVADINRDNWPDIYISNDLAPDDVLYINNRDGTFSDKSGDYLKHTSYAGMGVDIADFNNDGWPDILQADMMPPDFEERKLMSYGVDYEQYSHRINQGYNYSYTKNTLQMSNGLDKSGNIAFSEIGRMAGVAYTGWSWATLWGDYNNSGNKDILITNGFPKAINDFDYLIDQAQSTTTDEEEYQLLKNARKLELKNYLFQNNGGIKFSNVSEDWGFNEPGYSYGAAHGDLDNDGDLDIVINNLNAPASLYQNNSEQLPETVYLVINLIGPKTNRQGIGSKIKVRTGKNKQYKYLSPYRGYQSSVEPRIHLGLGQTNNIDSLEIFWPDGQYQLLTNVDVNQHLSVKYENAALLDDKSRNDLVKNRKFTDVTKEVNLLHKHSESAFNDYKIQPLLHRKLSDMGPKMAVGDVTGNGLDDVYIGGAAEHSGTLYIQNENGKFENFNQTQPWLADKSSEDIGSLFFDANGDGHLDLYVVSGGYEFSPAEHSIQDRLYINNGNGQFYADESALPRMLTSGSMVSPGDFNDDGRIDLFICGRLTPLQYPKGARSYILRNDGGKFTDVTEEVAPQLIEPSLRTDAEWIDFDGDGQMDLVTTGIWSTVEFYKNENGKFHNVTDNVTPQAPRGWWYSLEKEDFNNDGLTDLVAGNLGLNHTFTSSESQTFGMFANDFDHNFTKDVIYTLKENDFYYPFFGKARLGRAIPFINDKYSTYKSLRGMTMEDIFGDEILEESQYYQADTFASSVFINEGNGTYSIHELTEEAQISPVIDIIAHDLNQDNNKDLIIAGNIYGIHPDVSRADAGNGLWLKGNGSGDFKTVSPFQSGFIAPGDVKSLKLIDTPSGKALLVANNNDSLQVFRIDRE